MTFTDTLKGGQSITTLVIGRNCSYVELRPMLHIGRVLVDGFGENQYAISGDRPIPLTHKGKTAPVWICSADRGCTVTLEPYLQPGSLPDLLDETAPPEYSPGLLDRKKNKCMVLLVKPDGALVIFDAYHVGPYLIRDQHAYQIADDTAPLTYRDGKTILDLYIVDASRKTTANLFMHGDPAIMPPGEIPKDRTDPDDGGFLAGSLYSMRTSPDLASRVWDGNILKYGWELQANKRMVAIAFLLGAGVCFFGMMLLSLVL